MGGRMFWNPKAGVWGAILTVFLLTGPLWGEQQPFLLTGDHWRQLSYEGKVMYIKGVGNMADFEAHLQTQDRRACISAALVEELKAKTIAEVVREIDSYYQERPENLAMPVLEVLIRRATSVCQLEEKKK